MRAAAPSAFEHLRLGTPAGVVQHVGTQYEARILDGGTRIRVREGRVDVKPEHGNAQSAGVGEQIAGDAIRHRSSGTPSRRAIRNGTGRRARRR